jgi:hypothetical protein
MVLNIERRDPNYDDFWLLLYLLLFYGVLTYSFRRISSYSTERGSVLQRAPPPHTIPPINFSTARLITFPPRSPRFLCCRLFWAQSHLDSSQRSQHIPYLSLNLSSLCACKLTRRGGTSGSNGKTAKKCGSLHYIPV